MRRLLSLAALLALLAGCGGGGDERAAAPAAPAGAVQELRSIDQLREAFEERDGAPRLIALASPT